MWQKIKNKFGLIVLAALGVGAVFIIFAIWQSAPSNGVKIDFFDVGQGSAVFVAAPNGNQVLIDGGPSDAILAKLGEAMPIFDRRIEMLILTHPDSDHLSGLIEVLQRYQIGQILETGIKDESAEYSVWHNLIKEKNIPVVLARAGETVKVADNLSFKVIYPAGGIAGQEFKDTNDSSLVGKLIYGQNEILLVGDADIKIEEILLWQRADLQADILLVAHHGSKNSSSADFLAAIAPAIAVIQNGLDNRYGHPHQETLARLAAVGAAILRTDQTGDVIFNCDLEKCLRK
ncbi:MAG: internalization-related competence protein ComEC/Rec2 protein [Parcubacteria group bacterium GW2011_GWC2_42_6]|nr:MAG: internalization-related competence protein ComEC/Rec2 protein [Parcubacteria group bacterium GW2011_GWA2_42_11]KKS67329.1 MAG: internalization-related competence protein ComEC/Rec2 protein [Parcubacteria group bacterium GW2011_GWC2_42_6]KKT76486.1 MAG: internalization-related competence protein ComEC/Rec2 protein [Parcubacteria group bacterium GW2011_GWF2_44_7]